MAHLRLGMLALRWAAAPWPLRSWCAACWPAALRRPAWSRTSRLLLLLLLLLVRWLEGPAWGPCAGGQGR